jgi:hypothetical protein
MNQLLYKNYSFKEAPKMSEKEKKETREKYSLDVTEFEPFNGTKTIRVVTTHNLAKMLNERIKPAFADYRGCYIEPMPNGQGLAVTFSFNQVPHSDDEDVAYGFDSVESKRGSGSIAERVQNIYSELNNGRKWQISQDAIDVFENLFQVRDTKKIQWDKVTSEVYERNGMFQEGHCVIYGVDFNKCMELIFGAKNDDGSKIYYNGIIMQPVVNTQMVRPNNWTLQLEMMTDASVQELCNEVGYVSLGQYNCVQA